MMNEILRSELLCSYCLRTNHGPCLVFCDESTLNPTIRAESHRLFNESPALLAHELLEIPVPTGELASRTREFPSAKGLRLY